MGSGLFWSLVLAAAAAAVYFFQKANTSSALTQQSPTISPSSEWALSENGNPTQIYKGKRITVFEADSGWKYCIAHPEDRREPYFSEAYETLDIAQSEAIRHMERLPSLHRSLPEQRRELRRQKEDEERSAFLSGEPHVIASLSSAAESAINLSELRKVERKTETRRRYIDRVADSVEVYGSDEEIERAQELKREVSALADRVQIRVAELKAKRKTPAASKIQDT
ncbi:hypothetical protein CN138_09485 [Sinorhizobium meliloti]|uniref:hypothetical protein n=1 Tax=Rhizobium meliloti TaxID=382 RepID=UPI000B4A034B|nr:hypothetical protein [Sinorhizobium meliloti]ASP98505.1 hypothetical protein CDO24_14335 [Sinorhizobium meliloti]MDW9532442.1 hypothetical protein [Sinorhizobium meliloti]MDW9581627.1 hypothetical protein [Sinorhizobium meliloti]MDW9706136.1 hypothetical protein [Sinorhizobium meliloti]MDW9936117.1 hypothetical protein [Sinorhizobium meliloti]